MDGVGPLLLPRVSRAWVVPGDRYHYLVSEMFMVAPMSLTHETFFALDLRARADIVWRELFVLRTPLSEACGARKKQSGGAHRS